MYYLSTTVILGRISASFIIGETEMITEQAQAQVVKFRGKLILPSNVCAHCGKVDDPDSAWEQDKDEDRICLECHAMQVMIVRFAKRTD